MLSSLTPNPSSNTVPIWPPPVPGYTGLPPRPAFISQRRYQMPIAVLAVVLAILQIVEVVALKLPLGQAYGTVNSITTLLEYLALLPFGIIFLIWVQGTYRNLDAFRTEGKTSTPGWVVAYYFIPILSLYRPYNKMDEVWKASNPDADSRAAAQWQKSKGSGLILTWWLLYVSQGLLAIAYYGIVISRGNSNDSLATLCLVTTAAVYVAGLIWLYRVVAAVNDRQEKKEQVMLAEDAEAAQA